MQAAIGQKTSAEELGGAKMHSADQRHRRLPRARRRILPQADSRHRRQDGRAKSSDIQPFVACTNRSYPAEELYGIFSGESREAIRHARNHRPHCRWQRVRRIHGRVRRNPLCGYARIGGWAVGIVANQKKHVTTNAPHSDQKRIEFGGVIYTESAEKAARFIMDCNQNRIPLVFLHDVNGFMVGKDAEWSGIIRAGAKMVNAVANSVVPKISVIIGGSFGAGNYAMCGKAYDPRFMFAWPTAKFAVMSGDAAANTLAEIKLKQLEREGKKVDEKVRKEMIDSVHATYEHQTDPRYAAARLWLDAIIDPAHTRDALIWALNAASLNTHLPDFKTGVLQT